MIHLLALKNFKQHKSLYVSFTEGLNVISGANGAGKTTILKGILYALYGTTGAGNKAHLQTKNTEGKLEVQLEATLAGRRLSIYRSFDRAVIQEGEEILASGHSPCTQFITELLGLDAKQFKHLSYAAQGEAQALLAMGASDLQRKIEVISKLTDIDEIITLISKDISSLEGKLSALPPVADLKELEAEISELTKTISLTQEVTESKKQMIDSTQNTLAERKKELAEIRKALSSAKETKAVERMLLSKLHQVTDTLTELDEAKPEFSVNELETKIAALTKYIQSQQSKLDVSKRANSDYNKIRFRLTDLEVAYNNVKKEEPYFKDHEQLTTTAAAAKLNRDSYATQLKVLQAVESVCPACTRPFDDVAHTHHVEELERIKAKFERAEKTFELALSDLKTFENFNSFVKGTPYAAKLEQAKQNYYFVRDELEQLDTSKILTPEHEQVINETLTASELDLAQTKRSLDLARNWHSAWVKALTDQAKLHEDLARLNIEECEWNDEDLAFAEAEVTELEDVLRKEEEEYHHSQSKLLVSNNSLKSKQSEFDKANLAFQQRVTSEFEKAQRAELQKYLRENRARLMADTWDKITQITSAHTATVTENLISGLERDSSGGFTVIENGVQLPVEELSGARQSIVGLSLRLAIGQAFYGDNSFLLLDEITADCSEDNAAAVAGLLQGLGLQTIVVSHRQGDTVNATNVIVLG